MKKKQSSSQINLFTNHKCYFVPPSFSVNSSFTIDLCWLLGSVSY